ncbi:MAG: hypothetical protein RI563_11765 [Thiohalophilus sp.]|uniref:hypothetical protein n=1 Tax=Thiohalophilus sp. TaxID=3028392 RepID=UPI0028705658|nr:hypothetical protein [Thiohalophilus sp.]MDR9437551.1 hypothetical protein [Thiohalophilus sp.]
MKKLKLILFGVIIGLAVGLWTGVNIGKGKPLLSNPFDEPTLKQRLKESTGEAMERAGKKVEKLGSDIKGKIDE